MPTIWPAGFPTATVIRARGNFSLIARSDGRLITTSPSCPKSMTRMLPGSKLIPATQTDNLRLLQMLVEKVSAGKIRAYPILMAQEIVNLVGINYFFKVHPVLTQQPNQIHRLRELNVPIVVAMNKQHRRLPFINRRDWRRFT